MKKLTHEEYNRMKTEQLVIKSQITLLFMKGKNQDEQTPFTTYFEKDNNKYVGLNFSSDYPDPHNLSENFFFKVIKVREKYKFEKVEDPKFLLGDYERQIMLDDLWQYHEDEKNYADLPLWHPLYDKNGKSDCDN